MTDLAQAEYQLWLDTQRGRRRNILDGFTKLDYVRVRNGVGRWSITIPADRVTTSDLVDDAIVEIWRARPGNQYKLQMAGFLRRPRWFDESGRDMLLLTGPGSNEILRTRIVTGAAYSSDARKTDLPADDMMKAIVRENMGSDADAVRDLTSNGFTVEADAGGGPIISRSFAKKTVLEVLQEIASSARAQGVPVYFDVVPVATGTSVTFEFRTFINRRGTDRRAGTSKQTIFAREWGNLEAPDLARDAEDEVTYLYAGGQGEGEDREVVELANEDRINVSPWGRREGWINAADQNSTGEITALAQSVLDAERPRSVFAGNLKDTPQTAYGVDWDFGDSVTAEYRDQRFNGDVDRVHITKDRQETIEAVIETQDAATVTTFITWSASSADGLVTELGEALIA